MKADLWFLYENMLRSRLFEEAVTQLWNEGKISGELAARVLESGIHFKYGRVCNEETIPYNRDLEDRILPNTERIVETALKLIKAT
jgi:TPP-dependent pyruvate/acetoin dehydrogenase alpha subunit